MSPTRLHKSTPAPAKVNCHLSKTPLITVCSTSLIAFVSVVPRPPWKIHRTAGMISDFATLYPATGVRATIFTSTFLFNLVIIHFLFFLGVRENLPNRKKISCNTRYNGFQGMWLIETRNGMPRFGEG